MSKKAIEKTPRVTAPEPTPENAQGAPVERYRGERTSDEKTGDVGDIEEETLDRDAPFNKTYGTKVDE